MEDTTWNNYDEESFAYFSEQTEILETEKARALFLEDIKDEEALNEFNNIDGLEIN